MSKGNNRSAEELRRRAEKRLQNNKQKAPPSVTSAESQRLIHELEVHQIELEMQNEELQQARSELEAYLSQYKKMDLTSRKKMIHPLWSSVRVNLFL